MNDPAQDTLAKRWTGWARHWSGVWRGVVTGDTEAEAMDRLKAFLASESGQGFAAVTCGTVAPDQMRCCEVFAYEMGEIIMPRATSAPVAATKPRRAGVK